MDEDKARRCTDAVRQTRRLLDRGKPHDWILSQLQRDGWSFLEAEQITQSAHAAIQSELGSPQGSGSARSAAGNKAALGALIFAFGILVTAGSYASASDNHGGYVVATGALVGGFLRLATGLDEWSAAGGRLTRSGMIRIAVLLILVGVSTAWCAGRGESESPAEGPITPG